MDGLGQHCRRARDRGRSGFRDGDGEIRGEGNQDRGAARRTLVTIGSRPSAFSGRILGATGWLRRHDAAIFADGPANVTPGNRSK